MSTTRAATPRVPWNRRGLLQSLLVGGALGASFLGCSYGWDALDPRLGGSGGGAATTSGPGGSGPVTSAGGASSNSSVTSGAITSSGVGGASSSAGTGGTDGTSSGSTGSSSSTGGGGPAPCGGTSVLADDFPGGDPGELWQLNMNNTVVSETAGEAVIAVPNNSVNGSWGQFDSRRAYDLRGDSVSVEVTNATNPATTAQSWFGTGYDSNYLQISQKHGVLHFEYQRAGMTTSLKTTPYDPVAHRHWRFREDGVNTYWETSSDGAMWKVMTQVATATLFPMNIMWVWMGGGSDGGEVNPGAAHFDHLNGGGAPKEKWCPLSSFKDDFSDAAESLAWGRGWQDVPGMVARTGGQLLISLVPNQSSSATYATSTSFDLTGSSVVVEVPTAVATANGSETSVSLFIPGDNGIELSESQNHLHFGVQKSGTWTSNGSMIYTAAQQRWWRLRESAGTLYWDTSPDGKNWSSQAQLTPIPFPIDAVDLYLGGNGWASQPSPGASGFDNVNSPPP